MNRKKMTGLFLASALTLLLCACGGADDGTAGQAGAAAQADGTVQGDGAAQEDAAGQAGAAAQEDTAAQADGAVQEDGQLQAGTRSEADAQQPGFLDAARLENLGERPENRLWEVTIPYNKLGETDTDRSFTIRENEKFYLESYSFGVPGEVVGIGNANLCPCPGAAEAMEIPGAQEESVMVWISDKYVNAAELLELNQYVFVEKIDDRFYYLVERKELEGYEYIEHTLYHFIPKTSPQSGGNGGTEDLSEYLVVELFCSPDEDSNATSEEIKELLLQATDCILGDTGAPYLQDLLCSIDFDGYRVKNREKLSYFSKESYQEGIQTDCTLLLTEGTEDMKDVDALYVRIETDDAAEEGGVNTRISVQHPENYTDPEKKAEELTERYLERF